MKSTNLSRVTVIGCGLIGTSIALALVRAGVEVAIDDRDSAALAQAALMGAGTALTPRTPPADVVVIATPPSTVVDVLAEAQARGLGRAYTDVAGAKESICAEAELRGADLMGYVPGHPMAGRELSGPTAAQADLFVGRPWILCPYPTGGPEALAAVAALVERCGGLRRDMAPEEHDAAVAAISHAPQLVASTLAAQFADLDAEVLALAGLGVRDTTRIAASDRRMWSDILAQNPASVAAVVDRIANQLSAVAAELRNTSTDGSARADALLARGNEGRAALLAAAPETGGPAGTTTGDRADSGRTGTDRTDRQEAPRARRQPAGADVPPLLAGRLLKLTATVVEPDGGTPEDPARERRFRTGRPTGPVPRFHWFVG